MQVVAEVIIGGRVASGVVWGVVVVGGEVLAS